VNRNVIALGSTFALCSLSRAAPAQNPTAAPARPPKTVATGVKTPGVKIPMSKLPREAEFHIAGAPDWMAVDDSLWISNGPKNTIVRIDPAANKIADQIHEFSKPCSGIVAGFGSLWVPNCGSKTLSRVDLITGKIQATIPTTIANSEGGIAAGAGNVWLMADAKSTLKRIDPASNKVTATVSLPEGCYTPVFGFDAVWVTCTKQSELVRVNPATNTVVAQIKTGPEPRFVSAGEGGVWTLNQGDGSVSRIDPATNKVVATVQVGIPGEGGDISAAEGSVWLTLFDFPLSRIDPASNKVVQQFVGMGGDAVRAGRGSLWLTDLRNGKLWRLDPKKVAAVTP
jgi:virginiamycin B lyase